MTPLRYLGVALALAFAGKALASPNQVPVGAFSPAAITLDFQGFANGTIVTNQLSAPSKAGLTFSSSSPSGAGGGGVSVATLYPYDGFSRTATNFTFSDGLTRGDGPPYPPVTLSFTTPVLRVGFWFRAATLSDMKFHLADGTIDVVDPAFIHTSSQVFVGIEDSAGISSIQVDPGCRSCLVFFEQISVDAAALTITTTSLPDGVLTLPYPGGTLVGSGGQPPYTWDIKGLSITPTGLPAGLTLSTTANQGVITGGFLPDAEDAENYDRNARVFRVTATVTDSAGKTANQPLTLALACGDSRDDLIAEYVNRDIIGSVYVGSPPKLTFTQKFVPRCKDISRTARAFYYDFNKWNCSMLGGCPGDAPGQPLADPGVKDLTLLRSSLTANLHSGLDGWVFILFSNYSIATPKLSSGYRSPIKQEALVRLGITKASNSPHQFGFAVDLENPDKDKANKVVTWRKLYWAAFLAGASFIEPFNDVGHHFNCSVDAGAICVHADWRNRTEGYVP